jgi:hypothetical protein
VPRIGFEHFAPAAGPPLAVQGDSVSAVWVTPSGYVKSIALIHAPLSGHAAGVAT